VLFLSSSVIKNNIFELGVCAVYIIDKMEVNSTQELHELIMHLKQPEWFVEITLRCLAKNPDSRYSDAGDLLTDLKTLRNLLQL
jgi:hypothetical protein